MLKSIASHLDNYVAGGMCWEGDRLLDEDVDLPRLVDRDGLDSLGQRHVRVYRFVVESCSGEMASEQARARSCFMQGVLGQPLRVHSGEAARSAEGCQLDGGGWYHRLIIVRDRGRYMRSPMNRVCRAIGGQ